METLSSIYDRYSFPEGHGDKGTAHTYIDEYSKLLEPYRSNITFLEIGLSHGESIQMWSEYFEKTKIYGVDITDAHIRHLLNDPRFNIIIGDATKGNFIDYLPENIFFDVIIDDGSHRLNDQLSTFDLLKNKMNKGGLYIIEDVLHIDNTKSKFQSIHDNCEIMDNRKIKNRHDDVLVVYRF